MSITSENIIGLGRLQRSVLRAAGARSEFHSSGDLLGLHLDSRGWRPEGAATARRFLDEAARVFAAGDDVEGAQYTRAQKAAGARSYWGVTEPPRSGSGVALALGASAEFEQAPHGNSIANWAKDIAHDKDVLEWANDEFARLAESGAFRNRIVGAAVDDPRPLWMGPRPQWPPTQTWPPEAVPGFRERDALLASAAALVGEDLTEAELLQMMREVVADELQDRYFHADAWSKHYRHCMARFIEHWFELDELRARPHQALADETGHDGNLGRAVAVVVQMMFHDAVGTGRAPELAGSGRLARELIAVAAARRNSQTLMSASVATDRLGPERPLTEAARRTRRQFMRISASEFEISRSRTFQVEGGGWSASSQIDELYAASLLIRDSSTQAAAPLARDYVTKRALIHWPEVDFADVIRLELADQSVNLDVARLNDSALVQRMGELISSAAPTPQGAAYLALVHREKSLIYSKQGNLGAAGGSVGRGLADLAYLRERGMVETKAALEVEHQLSLRGAGVYVQMIEAQLRELTTTGSRVYRSERARRWAQRALRLSHRTLMRLGELQLNGDGLAAVRHADNHISTTAWKVQSQIIALRVRLAVQTAVASQLIEKPVPPADPQWAGAFTIDVASISGLYVGLLETQEVRPGDINEIVKLGMWFGLLNEGTLPLVDDLSPAFKDLTFMDGDPDALSADFLQSRTLDLIRSTLWLESRGHDSGILSYLPENGPVFRALDHQDTLSAWRSQFPVRSEAARDREREAAAAAPAQGTSSMTTL